MTGGPGGAAASLIDGFAIVHGYIKMFELDLVGTSCGVAEFFAEEFVRFRLGSNVFGGHSWISQLIYP